MTSKVSWLSSSLGLSRTAGCIESLMNFFLLTSSGIQWLSSLLLEVVWGGVSGIAARTSGKLQLFSFDATGAPECSCSRRSPGDAAALVARISSTGRDEG